MPRDLLADDGPRDLLAGTPPPPPEEPGIMARVGDFLIDNLPDASRRMVENARKGTFRNDAAKEDGFLDRAGSLIERGGAWVDRGLYDVLGALGSEKAKEAAAALDRGTVSVPVAGNTTWDDVNSVGSLGSYIADAGIESLPAMGALAVPWVGPALVGSSQTGNIARERVANDGGGDITTDRLIEAAPAAALSTALDVFGLRGIKNPVGNTITGRIAGAAAREGGTEAIQSGLEYGGGTIGTQTGFDPRDALGQMLAGGVAGAGIGGGVRGSIEAAQPVTSRIIRSGPTRQPVEPGQREEYWEGSLDDLLAPEQGAPQDLLALPPPSAANRPAAVQPQPEPQADPGRAGFLQRVRGVESGGNDNAKNPRSSARGRYQFIDSTWAALGGDPAKRNDPAEQERLMKKLTDQNEAALRKAGIGLTAGNYYLAHFAGAGGAVALHRNLNGSAESILGADVVKANPFLAGMTGRDVIAWAAGKMGGEPGITGNNGDIPLIDIPGADGSLLSRGDRQERIANLDIPEASPQQREAGQAKPIELDGAPEQSERAPLPELAAPRAVGNVSQVTTARGDAVDTQFELRDLPELIPSSSPSYDQLLQPRDRASRATSGAQVASIAANLDPAQLGDSRLASTGAPIIGPDGQVESGNGRIAAIQLAYQQQPERAQAYRAMIEAQGFDTTGMANPVLVRRRTTEMTPEQRQAWTRAANERDTMAMSSTEQASADARALDDTVLSMYRGGAVTAAANRDFVRAFINKAVSPAERNAMTAADGSISADGVRRVRFALLARAYGDTELIARISEDTDTNIAAIGKALLEAAPAFARLKAKIAAGEVPAQYDISSDIAEAARMVSRSRETGQSIAGMLAQTDAFSEDYSPEVEQVLQVFFRNAELTKPRSGAKVADALIDYANRAEVVGNTERQGPDMFGNAPNIPSPSMLLQQARGALEGDEGAQIDLLTSPPETATVAPDGQGDRPATDSERGTDTDAPGVRRAFLSARGGQLRALGIAQELRVGKSAALIGRTASTPKELAEIAQIYRDPRYETFRIFYTKGDEIVHATGVSSRSVSEAPLMPQGMAHGEWLAEIERTKKRTGADGYYLLHNHPSGDPDPSPADKKITRQTATRVEGFRGHVVINSGKFAEISVDRAGRSRSYVRSLDTGEEKLIAASVPHNLIGQNLATTLQLAVVAKTTQKPGWITVVGLSAKRDVRLIIEYPAETAKRDVKSLIAMARRLRTQSGSSFLMLIGDSKIMNSPTVARAVKSGVVDGAIEANGNIVGFATPRAKGLPVPPGRYVAEEQSPLSQTIEIDGKQRSTLNSDGRPLAKDEEGIRNFWRWFGDSKVVDAEGRPLVVYHGTRSGEIEAFDPAVLGSNTKAASAKEGFFFAGSPRTSLSYVDRTLSENDREAADGVSAAIDNSILTLAEWAELNAGEFAKSLRSSRVLLWYTPDDPGVSAQATSHDPDDVDSFGSYIESVIDEVEWLADDLDGAAKERVDREIAQMRAMLERYQEIDLDGVADEESGSTVIPAYLKIESPAEVDQGGSGYRETSYFDAIRQGKANGSDGTIIRNTYDGGGLDDIYVAFSPTQIKSINNRGTFDAEDPRILREAKEPFSVGGGEGGQGLIDKLVNRDGLTRDAKAIRDAVGNPLDTLKGITRGGFAEMGRAVFYTMDSRLRGLAERYNSQAINDLADLFHARAGRADGVTETYHEAVEREGFGRASQAWKILAPFYKDKEAMDRIGLLLRDPKRKGRHRATEVKAARDIAKLLKDTIDYRKAAGEDIGEVTDGYFPRFMDVEKVVKNKDLFLRQATELYRKHGAENPRASASAWLARIYDQYAGLDGGLEYASLFRDTRPAGVGRKTTKGREFGKDADTLLGEFYDNDTGSVLAGYFIGAARKAEEARRFGLESDGNKPLQRMMNRIRKDVSASGEDAGDVLDTIAGIINTNLGRIDQPSQSWRSTASVLHTAGQLGTLDRATYTSLSEAMMGFVRAGPKYGIPMLVDSAREFGRQLRGASPTEAGRMAEVLGIASDIMVSEALAARNGYEMANTSRRAQKVQQGFFQATGLHQWTEGTRTAAVRMGQKFMADNAEDVLSGRNAKRASDYLREVGIKDPKAFAQWLAEGNTPTIDSITKFDADPMIQQYRAALVRFVNQTIMKPTRAEKPAWASHPVYGLMFSLMSFSYGFKKNVLDRVARQTKDAVRTGDMSLLYPAFGMAGLFAVHTVLQNALRQAIFGGGREDDEEGIDTLDVVEAVDRAGLTGAASRPLNALLSLKYRASIIESMVGPTVGRPVQILESLGGLATDANSPNTNTAERKAAATIYDVVLEPAIEAYGVTRLGKAPAAAVVWGTGNRDGGALPADRDAFIEAVAGPKED